jgi:hypothetical protein
VTSNEPISIDAKALSTAAVKMAEAIKQARLAYQFGASSYTFAALEACLAAARALDQHVSDLAFVHSAEWLRKFLRIEDRNAE